MVSIDPWSGSTVNHVGDIPGQQARGSAAWSTAKALLFASDDSYPYPMALPLAMFGMRQVGKLARFAGSKLAKGGKIASAARATSFGRGFSGAAGLVGRYAMPVVNVVAAYKAAANLGAGLSRYKRSKDWVDFSGTDPLTSYYHRNNRARAMEAVRKSELGMRGAFGNEAMLFSRS
jgi:hypothetical protein